MSEEKVLKIRNWGALDKRANRKTRIPNHDLAAFAAICSLSLLIVSLVASLWMAVALIVSAASGAVLALAGWECQIFKARKQRARVLHGPKDWEKRWALKHTAIPYWLAVFGAFIGLFFLVFGLIFISLCPGLSWGLYVVAGALIVPPYARAGIIHYCREEDEKIKEYLRGKAELDLKKEVI